MSAIGEVVFVVCAGEHSSGHSPFRVFSTLEAAKAAARASPVRRDYPRDPRAEASALEWDDSEAGVWRADVNGVDEMFIYAFEVLR